MKAIIVALTAVSVLAGVAAPASAGTSSEGYQAYEVKHRYVKKKHKKRHYRQYSNYQYTRRGSTNQPQYWAEKLPYGSQIWWQQMDREGRGGRRP